LKVVNVIPFRGRKTRFAGTAPCGSGFASRQEPRVIWELVG
jgi:hypothetical protein